jgi:hypothetical protein
MMVIVEREEKEEMRNEEKTFNGESCSASSNYRLSSICFSSEWLFIPLSYGVDF